MTIQRQSMPQRIAAVLRQEIARDYQVGQKMPPETQLAERFGVSVLTVREAMGCLVAEGLIVRKRRAGTTVLRRPARRYVAILCDNDLTHPGSSYYFARILFVLWQYFEDHGVLSRTYIGRESAWLPPEYDKPPCGEFYDDLEQGRICGVVPITVAPRFMKRMQDEVARAGVPMAGYNHGLVNYDRLIREGVQRLVDAGRRRLALISCYSPNDAVSFRDELSRHGLEARPEWIRNELSPGSVGAGWELFMSLWTAAKEKPDGLIITDDVVYGDAAKAILAVRAPVPDDLSVISLSNRGSGMVCPFPTGLLETDTDMVALIRGRQMLELLAGGAGMPVVGELPFEYIPPRPSSVPVDLKTHKE